MLKIDCDFHIHGRYSGATSKNLSIKLIAENARIKGLNIIATGDALHKLWLEEIEAMLDFENGIGRLKENKNEKQNNNAGFVLTTEVEDVNKVHHLILFPDLESVYEIKKEFSEISRDIDLDGRAHLHANGEEIAKICHKHKALIGPSHAFVPWTSIYKEFDSIKQCYHSEKIDFLELGLSADTQMASKINELNCITFLSNSDAHSAMPHRLGREFNRLIVKEITFSEIEKAIKGHGKGSNERKVILNVGLDPRLGKYHRTSCIKCFAKYSLEEAEKLKWRCKYCRGIIKKGVKERIDELVKIHGRNEAEGKDYEKECRMERAPYLRIAPLSEIIAQAYNIGSVYSAKVLKTYNSFLEVFKNEIEVLLDADIENVKRIDSRVGRYIERYRKEDFKIEEGGGGRYGKIIFESDIKNAEAQDKDKKRTTLDSYF